MLAVLLMALLAGAVAMSFSRPLKAARTADATDLLRSFDMMGRQAAAVSDHNIRLVFDLASESLQQRDGADLANVRTRLSLPQGCRIDAVRVGDHLASAGEAMVDISTRGWSKTYALHLAGPGTSADQWLVFAGMTGQMTQVQNESQIPTYRPTPGHHAD